MPIRVYGSSIACMPPNFCTSSVDSRTSASITSSTVTMPSTWPASSSTGMASRSYFEISRATSSRSVSGFTVTGLRVSPTWSTGRVRLRQHDVAERHHADQPLVPRLEHVDRVHRLLGGRDLADVALHLVHRPGGGHPDELGGHDAARRVGREAEQQAEDVAGWRGEEVDEPGPGLVGQLAEELHLLVGGKRLDQRRGPCRLHAADQLAAPLELRLVEHLYRAVERQRGSHLDRRLDRQPVQPFRDVRRQELGAGGLEILLVTGEEVEELGGERGGAGLGRGSGHRTHSSIQAR